MANLGGASAISVVIATRDRATWLAACLDSVARQTERPGAVVVIDDGSVDETPAVLAAFAEQLPLTVARSPSRGMAAARNLGTALTPTRYICVMDDDDLMLPNRIADHARAVESDVDISCGGWINFWQDAARLEFIPGKTFDADIAILAGRAFIHGGSMYRREVLTTFPYQEELQAGADFDMNARALAAGARASHTGSYLLLRRRHEASIGATQRATQSAARRVKVGWYRSTIATDELASRTARARAAPSVAALERPSVSSILASLDMGSGERALQVRVPRSLADMAALVEAVSAWDLRLGLVDSPEFDERRRCGAD